MCKEEGKRGRGFFIFLKLFFPLFANFFFF
jgi:hypothetical protein